MATKPTPAPQHKPPPFIDDGKGGTTINPAYPLSGTLPQPADGQLKRGKRSEKTPEQIAARKTENRKRFLTYAAKRTESALRALRNVKRLANKAGYDYTTDEVDKICSAIVTASMDIRKAFDGQKEKANAFTL